MKISKKSLLTGIVNELEIPIEKEDYLEFLDGEPLDLVAPYLSRADKNFILTGITIEEYESCS